MQIFLHIKRLCKNHTEEFSTIKKFLKFGRVTIAHIKMHVHAHNIKKREGFRTSIAHVNKNQFIYLFRLTSMNRFHRRTREETPVARSTLVFFLFFPGLSLLGKISLILFSFSFYSRYIFIWFISNVCSFNSCTRH